VVEELLELFVGVVDTELFETIQLNRNNRNTGWLKTTKEQND